MQNFSVFFALLIASAVSIFVDNNEEDHLGMINGATILPHSMPFLAFLRINGNTNQSRCGGALISQNYILTSARCVYGAVSVEVVLGVHNISSAKEKHLSFISSNFTIHYDFDNTTLENDIALITLPRAVPLSDSVKPIVIAKEEDIQNSTGILPETAGWGLQSSRFNDSYSDIPLDLFLKMIPNYSSVCDKAFGKLIQDTNICCSIWNSWAGPLNLCEGDFGGPLVLDRKKLIGVASFTAQNCNVGKPNVFTNVVKYRTWLLVNSDAPLE